MSFVLLTVRVGPRMLPPTTEPTSASYSTNGMIAPRPLGNVGCPVGSVGPIVLLPPVPPAPPGAPPAPEAPPLPPAALDEVAELDVTPIVAAMPVPPVPPAPPDVLDDPAVAPEVAPPDDVPLAPGSSGDLGSLPFPEQAANTTSHPPARR
jgi:hypothetical protein